MPAECGFASITDRLAVGPPILAADPHSCGSCRLKAGCGQDCPPHVKPSHTMGIMLRLSAVLLIAASLVLAADADLILHNGKIVTVDGRFSIRQAVAVKSGKITAV